MTPEVTIWEGALRVLMAHFSRVSERFGASITHSVVKKKRAGHRLYNFYFTYSTDISVTNFVPVTVLGAVIKICMKQ